MMAADYRHIGGHENRLGRHYSRFSPFWPAPALAGQSLALRKLCDAGSNRRSRAKDLSGEKAFAEGSMHDPRHWALRLSFTATHGIGFREIWRPHLSDRPLSIADGRNGLYPPQWNSRFSANFGDSMQLPDLSSLHCGIS